MSANAAVAAVLVPALLGGLCGCESTVDRARKIAAKGTRAFEGRGIVVARQAAGITTGAPTVLHDANGTAVVVPLKNTGPQPVVGPAVSVTVLDRTGKPVYKNDAIGLEPSLAHAGVLSPGKTVDWVDDQVQANGTPARATAVVGAGAPKPGALASLPLTAPKLSGDATSGIEADGFVTNTTKTVQSRIVVTVVARKASRPVAAGRAIIPLLKPGAKAAYHVFFIGNPTGATLSASAPPTAAG